MLGYVAVRGDVDFPRGAAHLGAVVLVPAHVRRQGAGDGAGQGVFVLGYVVQHRLAAVDADAEPCRTERCRAGLPQDVLFCNCTGFRRGNCIERDVCNEEDLPQQRSFNLPPRVLDVSEFGIQNLGRFLNRA